MNLLGQLEKLKQPILIIALLTISWWGAVDNLAAYVNGESIKDAAIIYGVARSINGVISLIQSAELGAIVGSIHPGELLDPINDLIERFSSVMAWSLSSLVLQKILLSVFSSYSFKIIFTICCALMLFWRWLPVPKHVSTRAWSIFLVIASLRFSIAIVCALTAAVDQSFIQKIEQTSLKTVQVFNSDISVGINEVAAIDEDINQELTELKLRVDKVNKQVEVKNADIAALEEKLAKLPKRSVWDKVKFKKKSDVSKAIENQINNKEIEIKRLQTQLTTLEAQLDCAVTKQAGGSCEGSLSKLKRLFSAEKISEISQKVNQTINDLITVLVTLVLTTIILPLSFLYLFYRLFRFFILIAPRFETKAESNENPILEDKSSLKN
jgi:hypothetical protein|tara:strand:- start:8 stop:1153 length:1146 start_codon:yes stop_codon:yes gene_type:complete